MYENIIDFLYSLVPTKLEIVTGGIAVFMGVIFKHLLGGWTNFIEILLILMVIDYLTGLCAAFIMPNAHLDSQKGFKGIIKKIVILFLVILAHQIDILVGQNTLTRDVILFFFIGNEGLSILENASNCGLPIPNKLRENLAQFTEHKKERK